MTSAAPYKEGDRVRVDQDREEGSNVITDAEIGVMLSQAKECQQPPQAGRDKEWIFS